MGAGNRVPYRGPPLHLLGVVSDEEDLRNRPVGALGGTL
jgi:hypothetical protein